MTRGELAEFVRVAGMGVVATADAEGNPEAALVDLAATGAGEVIFDGVSVPVEGLADALTGTERAEYGRIYTRRFPGSRALREEFAIVPSATALAPLLRRQTRVVPCRRGQLARFGGLAPPGDEPRRSR